MISNASERARCRVQYGRPWAMSASVEPQKKNALEHGSPIGKRQWQGSSSKNVRRCEGGIEASSELVETIVRCVVTVFQTRLRRVHRHPQAKQLAEDGAA